MNTEIKKKNSLLTHLCYDYHSVFRSLALAFPDAGEQPHFEKPSFRIGKKLFASLDTRNNRACVKLSAADQDVFCLADKTVIYPVSNKWGKQGWTFIELTTVKKKLLTQILTAAHDEVAKKK